MPAPNELTPEEEAMFAEHGVAPAGQGREPLADEQQGQQQEPPAQQEPPQQEQQEPSGDNRYRRADGTFMSRAEIQEAQTREATEAARQGQQQRQQGEQGGQQGQQGQQKEPKFVPIEALHEARERTRTMAQQLQLATTRMNQILTSRGQGEQQAPQMPDINEDPAGYIVALEQRLARFERGREQETEIRQLDTRLENDEAVFQQQRPDYQQASDHYVMSRARELLQFYPENEAQQILLNEAREIAKQSWTRGMSAAETIYNLAVARGYNPNAPQRQPTGQQQQQQQGQQGQGQGKPSAQAVVDSVNRGQQASRSLSGGNGAGRAAELNAEAILNMSDEEFEQTLGLGTKGANSRFAAIGG
jgi:hypothetical protein